MPIGLPPPQPQRSRTFVALPVPNLPSKKPKIQLLPPNDRNISPKKRVRTVTNVFPRKHVRIRENMKLGRSSTPPPQVDTPFEEDNASSGDLPWDADVDGVQRDDAGQPDDNVQDEADFPQGDITEVDDLSLYADAVFANVVGLYQICEALFVAQGWDRRSVAGSKLWFHVERRCVGEQTIIGCSCRHNTQCVHKAFMLAYGWERFPAGVQDLALEYDDCILFGREPKDTNNNFINLFSVPSHGTRTAKSRAIITHEGTDSGSGIWRCSKDKGINCAHLKVAQLHLQQLIAGDPAILALEDEEEGDVVHEPIIGKHFKATLGFYTNDYIKAAPRVRQAGRDGDVISYLPVLAPRWASLPTDMDLYPRPRPLETPPILMTLDSSASCPCGSIRTRYDESLPIHESECKIFTLTTIMHSRVQLQQCPTCQKAKRRHRNIGPDLRDLGIFNYNNRIMFTHDLLDDYTSSFTSSETPFVAWVGVVSRRYGDYESTTPFVSAETFRHAWFAYVSLQQLEKDFQCPACGPTPEITIWDGVTLAFNRKHLLPSLKPPTISDDSSPVRNSHYIGKQQLIVDVVVRKSLRRIVRGEPLVTQATLEAWDVAPGDVEQVNMSRTQAIEHVLAADDVSQSLDLINISLGRIFRHWFSYEAAVRKVKAPPQYVRLFLQLAADESVLQMANRLALAELDRFIQCPSTLNASRLVGIPGILDVLRYHEGQYPPDVLGLCEWLYKRGCEVLNKLITHETEVPKVVQQTDWRKSGCYYSLPQIRKRPKYPLLSHDIRAEASVNRGAKCSKFYNQYGKRRLTGGIMGVWCTHSISYGFHCVPSGEGRNDVFAAVLTRWPVAPKVIVYDFACALGPYCMTREPDYFADTIFGIDHFHSMDHTKCGATSFLSTYGAVNPLINEVNSSAAECGNGGLTRIRKSVSYMSQDRAIIYTKVFMSIWNRLKIQRM